MFINHSSSPGYLALVQDAAGPLWISPTDLCSSSREMIPASIKENRDALLIVPRDVYSRRIVSPEYQSNVTFRRKSPNEKSRKSDDERLSGIIRIQEEKKENKEGRSVSEKVSSRIPLF